MASVLGIAALHDLKITFHESILIPPSQETEERSIYLSNIDQILNYYVPTVHFFKAHPDFAPEDVVRRLKLALGRVLVPYDFVAGRFKMNRDVGRLEIDCNRAGASFVVASSEYSLDDLGDLVYPNIGLRQLAVQRLDNLGLGQEQSLCFFQVTSFKCGGFAIGLCTNHVLLDGISALAFIENLASQAFDDGRPLATVPHHDRRLLAAREPPRVDFNHPELFKPDHTPKSGVLISECAKEELDYRVFRLTSKAIDYLKDKARKAHNTARITSFAVVAALIWRCKSMSSSSPESDDGAVSTLLNAVDIRRRMDPPLPPSYCGNAVLVTYSTTKRGDIRLVENWAGLVEMVLNGPARVSGEYVRSVIDWMEINKGMPRGEYMVTSWLGMRFDRVEYPWGRPVHSGLVVSPQKDVCCVFADSEGEVINASVSLPREEMERFESSFREFFVGL